MPTTYNDFVSDLAKAKQAGITPIALGNQAQSGITQPLYSVMDALGDQSTIANYIYSLGQGSLDSQASGFPQAVAAMSDWAAKGYFTSQFAGLPETDAETQFVQGKGALPLRLLRLAAVHVAGAGRRLRLLPTAA